ncbi:hypothetical protein QTJ16_003667 [Diplocarpon rosae]|uniref:Uncharacterized protein n=1 Tax=Diplocarpon rosae TaxID=946125 RepID=A0AAD9WCI0_9HELO|nr:hypothetical protein QTJ16_003667 [Diplocarpon rosae]
MENVDDQSLKSFIPNGNEVPHPSHSVSVYQSPYNIGILKSPGPFAYPGARRPGNRNRSNSTSSRSCGTNKIKLGKSKSYISSSTGERSSSGPTVRSGNSGMSSTRSPGNMRKKSRSNNSRLTIPYVCAHRYSSTVSLIQTPRSYPGYWARDDSVTSLGSASPAPQPDHGWEEKGKKTGHEDGERKHHMGMGVGIRGSKSGGEMGPPATSGLRAPANQDENPKSANGNPPPYEAADLPPASPQQLSFRFGLPQNLAPARHPPFTLVSTVSTGTQVLLDTLAQRTIGAHCGEMAQVLGIEELGILEWMEDLLELAPCV